jgi:hypothetical protein
MLIIETFVAVFVALVHSAMVALGAGVAVLLFATLMLCLLVGAIKAFWDGFTGASDPL